MPKCSLCGKNFKTKKALKIHEAKVHPLIRSIDKLHGR